MLSALRSSDQAKVLAGAVEKEEAPFHCSSCHAEVVLRKGRIRIHHFAHKPPVTCARGQGETEEHHRAKLAIYEALQNAPNVTGVEIEKDLGTAVADVYAIISGRPVAIEVQRSNLSVATITSRTATYRALGVAVLWVGLPTDHLDDERYSPTAWEKWCHAAYFGRVYYWESGETLTPVHFNPHEIYVEPRSWFESGGNEQSAGGYYRTSKRYRTPARGPAVALSADFARQTRRSWSGGDVWIPECLIYVDRQEPWWR